jgi:hypothetical protein
VSNRRRARCRHVDDDVIGCRITPKGLAMVEEWLAPLRALYPTATTQELCGIALDLHRRGLFEL